MSNVVPSKELDMMLAILAQLPGPAIERMISLLIDRLDEIDGDPDLEGAGDEPDHSFAGDELRWVATMR